MNTDAELAVFEADHGDRRRALRLARQGYAAAPSVRSADALGWALTRAGRPVDGLAFARRALRLGSRDPLFLYHAGIAARAAGERDAARSYLARALEANPRFSPLHGPRAAASAGGAPMRRCGARGAARSDRPRAGCAGRERASARQLQR